jgi:hypothetical protein
VIYLLVWAATLLAIPDTRIALQAIAANELSREIWRDILTIAISPWGIRAALIAAAACGLAVIWRLMMGGRPLVDPRRFQLQALLVTALLAMAGTLAWFQTIDFVGGAWRVPVGVAFFALVALLPLVLVTSLSLRRDFQRRCSSVKLVGFARYEEFDVARYPRPAEFALWTLLLFSVYPLLSCISRRAASFALLMMLSAAALGAGAWAVWRFVDLEALPIWPELGLALLIAVWVFLGVRRVALQASAESS